MLAPSVELVVLVVKLGTKVVADSASIDEPKSVSNFIYVGRDVLTSSKPHQNILEGEKIVVCEP